MSREEKVVGVTGASGYIASWIVKLLLHRGYTVKGSVLDLGDPKQTQHLLALEGAKERLHLFEANLLKEGSFDSLVDGCEGVFHTASPVLLSPIDPQTEMIEPAVKGTLNVLRSCAKYSASIKRVVITSSMAAVVRSRQAVALKSDFDVDETHFSDPDLCRESKAWYVLSKTLAEEAAWKFAKENKIDLVATNPGFVIGPMLQPTLNLSMEMILNLINGSENTYPNKVYICIDVRDVALAHILAFEVPSASGRHCLVGHAPHYAKVLDILHQLYPTLTIPLKCENDEPLTKGYRVSQDKAKSLGIDFTPLEITLRDTIGSFKDNGFLNI